MTASKYQGWRQRPDGSIEGGSGPIPPPGPITVFELPVHPGSITFLTVSYVAGFHVVASVGFDIVSMSFSDKEKLAPPS